MTKSTKPKTEVLVQEEKTNSEKILDFVNGCEPGNYSMNEFLKSLYPKPINNEPPVYTNQHEAKKMRIILSELSDNKLVSFLDKNYMSLGRSFYEGEHQKQKHYTIANTEINFEK